FERVHFQQCGHEEKRVTSHCHFARNDPLHQCFGVWTMKREWWVRERMCKDCC
ncbi:uncharacterized protein BDR25DRAFT_165268, partial [Lindgomyces ingoldianus]